MLVLDARKRIVAADALAQKLLGRSLAELEGQSLEELWNRMGAREPDPVDRSSGGCCPVDVHSRTWVMPNGEPRHVAVRETTVTTAHEGCTVVLLAEVAALGSEYATLLECRKRFDAFMRHLPGVAYMKDREGRYVFVSPTFERHFGHPPEHYVGKLDADVWPPEVVQQLRDSDARVLESGAVVQSTERVPQSDGTHYWLATKFPITNAAGEVVLIGGVAVDITEERRALESLKELQRSAQQRDRLADVGAITAQILHDLANPIAGLSMQVQLILRRAGRDPDRPVGELVQSLGRLLSEVQRLDVLLREFKDFAREQRLELRPVRLRPFLAECVTQWRPVARARDISIHTELPPDLPTVRADPDQLRRAFDNLIKNSIEAIDRGPGAIWVRSAIPHPERVRISVLDDGPGIAPHVDPFRLFETTKPYGTGLGLPIVRQIVEAHGGQIAYEPREPRGVAFHVELPRTGPSWPLPPRMSGE